MSHITGWKIIGIGLVAIMVGFILYLASCERIVYWPGCEEYRDIPVVPQLSLPIGFSGLALLVIGGIMNALRKPDLPTENEQDKP
jgi:hypothetical protein